MMFVVCKCKSLNGVSTYSPRCCSKVEGPVCNSDGPSASEVFASPISKSKACGGIVVKSELVGVVSSKL